MWRPRERSAGAKVTVPARDHDKAATALEGLDGVEIEAMDLIDPASIDAFAERFLASGQTLHILMNSAGIMASPLVRDARGYESHFATNHLGHFQLVARFGPPCARQTVKGGLGVVLGSSQIPVLFEEPNFEQRDYERWSTYGQSTEWAVSIARTVTSHRWWRMRLNGITMRPTRLARSLLA